MLITRTNIKVRLPLCFALIFCLMLIGNGLLLWQSHVMQTQATYMNAIEEQFIEVLRVHDFLLSFQKRFNDLAESRSVPRLQSETPAMRAQLEESLRRTKVLFTSLPADEVLDPTLLPRLEALQARLPSELEALQALGTAGDWDAIRWRAKEEFEPLEEVSWQLVNAVQVDAETRRAEAAGLVKQARRHATYTFGGAAAISLLVAGFLGVGVTRSITAPLRSLVEGSAALARGDFQHRVPVDGRDELANLAAVFNETTRTLQNLYQELQRRETYLAEAQRLTHTGSWAWRVPDRNAVHLSEEWYRIFGFDPAEGAPAWERRLERVHPEDRLKWKGTIERAIEQKADCDLEFRILFPNGKVRWIHTVDRPVLTAEGDLVEFLGSSTDITERKCAEQERKKLRQLEAELAHTNRVTMLGEMAASLAHEIKQPIAAAITSTYSCIEWLAHEPPNLERARAAAARINKYGNRAAEIIDRIRSFYRKSPPQSELVDVNGIIEEMLTLLKEEAIRYSVSMRTELAADLPKITADRVQLQQVFMNLMLNAIEAMKDSGGEFAVRSQVEQDGQLRFSVSDTGVGLPKEAVGQIFSAFFTTKPQGSGMGLAISRSIVESHGGRLWATANEERGATFHFTLPAQTTETSSQVHPPQTTETSPIL